jgi:pSer/pThr/pTyr-binding forkhead associated (FHA) protein
MDYLEITDAHGRRRRIGLDRPRMLIGREPACDIYLPHPNVSRRHAQLQLTDQGRWMLQDLSSLNHVFVDNRPVKQILLELGTEVRIAEYRLALKEAGTEREGSTPSPVEESTEAWTGLEPGWLEQLQVFQRSLLRLEEPRAVLERLAAEFGRIVQPQLTAVGLATKEKYRWEVMLSDTQTLPAALAAEAARRMGAEDSDVQTWNLPGSNGDAPGTVPPLCLLFPIKGRTAILGHVLVQRPRFCPLPSAMQRYLTLLTTYAGLVWDNFQLAALRLAQKEMQQELDQARQIQIDLFPPIFEVDDRLNAFAVNLPSVQVSGDYYDLFRTGPDTVAFVVADAMGHGMPAALMMAAVRASLRMGVAYGLPWQAVFEGLDGIITQAKTGRFVTGLVGQIDLHRHELQMVSAGHLPPSLLIDGQPIQLPEHCQTRPWGINFDCPWEVGRIPLGSGDWSILCYTDGITDAAVRAGRGHGSRVVGAYHQQNHSLSAEDLCQGLLSEISARQDPNAPVEDDQTVLVLRSAIPK